MEKNNLIVWENGVKLWIKTHVPKNIITKLYQ